MVVNKQKSKQIREVDKQVKQEWLHTNPSHLTPVVNNPLHGTTPHREIELHKIHSPYVNCVHTSVRLVHKLCEDKYYCTSRGTGVHTLHSVTSDIIGQEFRGYLHVTPT